MLICILAKVFVSFLSFVVIVWNGTLPLWVQAVLVGILPIWSEVLASAVTRFEPSRESSRSWLKLDAVADATVFVLAPAIWLFLSWDIRGLAAATLVVFVACGLYRILRFLRTGLDSKGFFEGLPVTYTGYQWVLLVCIEPSWFWLSSLLLLVTSIAMISKKKFVKVDLK